MQRIFWHLAMILWHRYDRLHLGHVTWLTHFNDQLKLCLDLYYCCRFVFAVLSMLLGKKLNDWETVHFPFNVATLCICGMNNRAESLSFTHENQIYFLLFCCFCLFLVGTVTVSQPSEGLVTLHLWKVLITWRPHDYFCLQEEKYGENMQTPPFTML